MRLCETGFIRIFVFTHRHDFRAPRMKITPSRAIDWGRHITLQLNFFDTRLLIHLRYGGKERARIRMLGRIENLLCRATLNDPTKIHHRHFIRKILDNGKIVRNKEISEIKISLQRFEKIQYLRLHGYIQRTGRFITDDKLWIDSKTSRDTDALPLTTRELMGVAVYHIWR